VSIFGQTAPLSKNNKEKKTFTLLKQSALFKPSALSFA
jgi:hypothetical protein